MADHRTSTLQYGHLGTVSYLPDVQCWEFPRKLGRDQILTFLGGVRVSPGENSGTPRSLTYERNDIRPARNVNSLLDAHPDLAPSCEIIGLHEAQSQAITTAVSKFDPLASSRFALANASVVDENRLGDQHIAIAAFTSSGSPASLRLLPLGCDSVEWPLGGTESVEVPITDNAESAWWTRKGGPILQVISPEALDEKEIFVAVRFSLSTAVLQPLYHRSFPRGNGLFGESSSNALDANPLVEILYHATGGFPHADVAFNPWYQRQVAIVDASGNWSIWDIQGRQSHKGHWSAERGPCGSLAPFPGDEIPLKGEAKDNHDGWAAILWAGNVNQLLVCDRRTVALFRTDTHPPQRHSIDLQFERRSEWVLNVRRSKYNPNHVFIVTSTRVYWIAVSSDDGSSIEMEGKASILLSWRHFRDVEDTSLNLTPFLIQDEISLVLYSQLNALAQVFRFSMSADDPPIPISVSDPSILSLPPNGGPDAILPNFPPPRTCFSSIFFKEIEQTAIPNPTNDNETLRFVKFMGQDNNSRIVEALYCAKTENKGEIPDFAPTDSISPSTGKRPVSILSSTRAGDDDFVVDDEYESAFPSRPFSQYKTAGRTQHVEQWADQYVAICSSVDDLAVSKNPETEGFNDWLGPLSTMLHDSLLAENGLFLPKTMLDIVEKFPIIDDIDENPAQLGILIKDLFGPDGNLTPGNRLAYLPLPWSSMSELSPTYYSSAPPNLDVTGLYDIFVSDWLSSLSGGISGRIRVAKERLIRKIITELTLSRLTIFRREDDQPHVLERDNGTSIFSDPDLHSHPASSFTNMGSSQATEFTLPSSQPQSQALPDETSPPTYSTLRLYTTLDPQSSIPKRVATTLSHWKVGFDPSAYDWQNTIRTLQEDEEESQTSQRRRSRAERKRKLQLERASRRSEASSSVPPSVRVGGSQPEAFYPSLSQPRFMQSSQVTQEEGLPMSQVVRGPFGSREASKKSTMKERKKKRAAGF